MGYTGPMQMGYGARTFSTHINNGGGAHFLENIYVGQILFVHFCAFFNTRYYLC